MYKTIEQILETSQDDVSAFVKNFFSEKELTEGLEKNLISKSFFVEIINQRLGSYMDDRRLMIIHNFMENSGLYNNCIYQTYLSANVGLPAPLNVTDAVAFRSAGHYSYATPNRNEIGTQSSLYIQHFINHLKSMEDSGALLSIDFQLTNKLYDLYERLNNIAAFKVQLNQLLNKINETDYLNALIEILQNCYKEIDSILNGSIQFLREIIPSTTYVGIKFISDLNAVKVELSQEKYFFDNISPYFLKVVMQEIRNEINQLSIDSDERSSLFF